MTKYHFNKDTGRTGKCEAKIKCRLGLADSEHFETREEAQQAFEKTMENKSSKSISKDKNKNKDLDTVKFDFTDKYPYDQDQNLNGRTVAEYRKFVLDSVTEYGGRKDEITDAIVDKIDIAAWKNNEAEYYTYHAKIVDKDKIEVSHYVNGNAFGLPEGDMYEGYSYDEETINNLNPEEFIHEDFVKNEYFKDIEPHIGGYYNEEQELVLTYRIPGDLQKDAEGALNASRYWDIGYIAANPAFPDWAVIPANITIDQDTKTFDNLEKLQRPVFPSNKLHAIDRKLNPERERERLTKSLENNKKQREEWSNKLEKVNQARTKHNTTSSRNDYVNLETKIAPENLTRKQRERLASKIEKKISDLENTFARNEERLKNVKDNLSPQERSGLLTSETAIRKTHADNVRQYTIDKLSRHYPRSNESVRKKEAAKWVDSHPEILDIYDF